MIVFARFVLFWSSERTARWRRRRSGRPTPNRELGEQSGINFSFSRNHQNRFGKAPDLEQLGRDLPEMVELSKEESVSGDKAAMGKSDDKGDEQEV